MCDHSIEPLLRGIEHYERIRLSVYIGGTLLDHITKTREDLLVKLKSAVRSGRIEILGGLFYGCPAALVPENDVRGQAEMMAEFWESLLGVPPTGFWLPRFTWCAELPRILVDSGFEYGFLMGAQINDSSLHEQDVVVVERGGDRLAGFHCEQSLSGSAFAGDAAAWVSALIDKAMKRRRHSITAYCSGESVSQQIIEELFSVINGSDQVACMLPAPLFQDSRPMARVALLDAPDFPVGVEGERSSGIEAVNMQQRMVRVSNKLREAIGTMEDEGREDEWSDELATIQRLVFSAQGVEAFIQDSSEESSSALMTSTSRLIESELMLDTLVQEDDEWMITEEDDRDADLVDEVFIHTPHASVCVAPGKQGSVTVFDDRTTANTMLSYDGKGLKGLRPIMHSDARSADEALGAAELLGASHWQVISGEVDEETYIYRLDLTTTMSTSSGDSSSVEAAVLIPMTGVNFEFRSKVQLTEDDVAWFGFEIPVRHGSDQPISNGTNKGSSFDDVNNFEVETARGVFSFQTNEPVCVRYEQRGPIGVITCLMRAEWVGDLHLKVAAGA
jgi:hypothetical protein